jgi:RNase H-fold protein (predicted Holliday junction resolvase)
VKVESPPPRILAIDPTSRGFGFAVLEGPAMLVDWGVRETRGQSSPLAVRKILDLVQHYQPGVLVVENCNTPGSRRGESARRLIEAACGLAKSRRVKVARISVSAARKLIADEASMSKHAIATAITERFPELASRLPPARKVYTSEPERMGIFDALAFALAYYSLDRLKVHAPS